MTTTIDQAGRVVIPAGLRHRAGLRAGTSLIVRFDNGSIVISRNVPAPGLEDHKGRLIARPRGRSLPEVDIAGKIEEERNRWPL